MLTFNPSLKTILDGATSKLDFSNKLTTALGTTRVLRCFRDANATAANPFATGTEFYKANLTGPITTTAGAITGFGVTSGQTIALGADLASGAAIVRIEGGGNFVQCTLGLDATSDLALPRSPLANEAITFAPGASFNAYHFLASGTGPTAPVKPTSAPNTLKIYDWTNQAAPVLVGTMSMTNRKFDFVYQDAEMAASIGDVAVYQTPADTIWGNFSFGATLLIGNASNTIDGQPLYQVLVAMNYKGAWTTYPEGDTYSKNAMVLNPPPFKITLEDGAGVLLNTFQMSDGKPINDPALHSDNNKTGQGRDATFPLRPKVNCAMVLPWQNTRPRVSDIASKIYPGMQNYRQTMSKTQSSFLSCEPLVTGGYGGSSQNGLGGVWYAKQFPTPYIPITITDPFLDQAMLRSGSSAQYAGWIEGYGYEPGSYSLHNWYTGPGGPRQDRSTIPSILALFADNPTGVRVQDSTPHRDIADGFLFGYFNHSNHWYRSPSSLDSIPKAEVLAGQWTMADYYYSNGSDPRGAKAIILNGNQRSGTDLAANYDSAGNMIYSGWGRDPLHDYANAGWGSLLLNSPMHTIGSKVDTLWSFICHGNPNRNVRSDYMVRSMAWEWLHYAIAWKLASTHPLGMTQQEIEARFSVLLESTYRDVYAPVFLNNEQSVFAAGLRNLGTPVGDNNNGTATTPGGHLGFYMAHVLQLFKQTGFWSRMYAKGGHGALVMKNLLDNLDKYCFDQILDTPGDSYGSYSTVPVPVPASWAAVKTARIAANDPTLANDFIHTTSGTTYGNYLANVDVSDNQFAQWPAIRRDYYPEFSNARLTAAVAKFDQYETTVVNTVAAAVTNDDKRNADYTYRYPGLSQIKPPAAGKLGPA